MLLGSPQAHVLTVTGGSCMICIEVTSQKWGFLDVQKHPDNYCGFDRFFSVFMKTSAEYG